MAAQQDSARIPVEHFMRYDRRMRTNTRLLRAALILVFSATAADQLAAQADTTHKAGKPLFTRNDAWLALGFAGVTVAG